MPQEYFGYEVQCCNREVYEREANNPLQKKNLFGVVRYFESDQRNEARKFYAEQVRLFGDKVNFRVVRIKLSKNIVFSNFIRIKCYQSEKYYKNKEWE